jgi:hypothetical protein
VFLAGLTAPDSFAYDVRATICLLRSGPQGVQHFRIAYSNGEYNIGGRSMPSLDAIVMHYLTNPLCHDECMKFPVAPMVRQPFSATIADAI